jgi:hypothetical protein
MTDAEFEKMNAEFCRLLERGRRTARLVELAARRSLCRDCDRKPEFYMIPRELWQSAFKPGVSPTGCLCLNCLERRLARRLTRAEIGDGGPGLFDGRRRLRRSERMEG